MTELPAVFTHLLGAWNETDPARIRAHLAKAVSEDVTFCDPNYQIRGIDAFEEMVRAFRAQYPDATCAHTSGLDRHHDICRYAWLVSVAGAPAVAGMDVAQIDGDGLICRIDGFFGPLPPK